MHEIDAIASLREIDRQQTTILEAKDAPTERSWKIKARAGAGGLRSHSSSSDIAKGKRTQAAGSGDILFDVGGIRLLQIDHAGGASARKVHLYGMLCPGG